MKHIGIVGCSAEGASLCYRSIIEQGIKALGGYQHPEVTLHTFPLSTYMRHLEGPEVEKNGPNWHTAGEELLTSVEKLRRVGAGLRDLSGQHHPRSRRFGEGPAELAVPSHR